MERLHMDALTAWIGHSLSLSALFGAVAGLFPPIAALASFLWFALQIYESRTFQNWSNNRRIIRQAKRLARLRARERVILAEIAAVERLRHARMEAVDLVAEAKAEVKAAEVKAATEVAAKLPPI